MPDSDREPNENTEGFAPLLRRIRSQRGWSLRRLGAESHYSYGYVWDLERGLKAPSPAVAAALDDALRANGRLAAAAEAADHRLNPHALPHSREAERKLPARLARVRRRRTAGVVSKVARVSNRRRQLSVEMPSLMQEERFEAEDALAPLERLFTLTDSKFTDDKVASTDRMIAGFIEEYETRGPRELGPR